MREALFVSIAQLYFLTFHEKVLLAKSVESLEELSRLTLSGIELIIGRLIKSRNWHGEALAKDAEKVLYLLRAFDIRCIIHDDVEYPALLREIFDPPFLLYVRGNSECLHKRCVSSVGTRKPSMAGVKAAHDFAFDAASDGRTVVSGFAFGIDAASHRGAYEAENGATVGVLATGCDTVTPASNRALAGSVIAKKRGCLVSEYPPGSAGGKWRFVQRNRIIAGLSDATLVVEAPEGSGALITADYALEMDREVFFHSSAQKRSLQMKESESARTVLSYIRDGAKVIDSYKDFLTWQN